MEDNDEWKDDMDDCDENMKVSLQHLNNEIERIHIVAKIHKDLKKLLPEYNNEYLEAYEEISNRLKYGGSDG